MKIKTFDENRKLFIKKIIAVILLLMIVAIAVVLVILTINKQKEEEYLKTYGMTAITVGEHEATYDMYRCYYLNYRDELLPDYTVNGVTDTVALDREIRMRVLNDFRNIFAIVSLAGEHGLSVTSSEVTAIADTFIEEMKVFCKDNKMDFDKKLSEGYMTEQAFVFFQRAMALKEVLFTTLTEKGSIIENDDAKIREFLHSDDFIRIKSVFVENDDGEDVEANRALATEVLEKYKSGIEFDKLIGQYSEEIPGGEAYIMHGEREGAFETAAFSLDVGEVSGVVESTDGFYIIVRLEKDDAYLENYFAELKASYQDIAFNRIIKQRADMLVATESDYVRSLSYEEIK